MKLIVIGASLGGVEALKTLFSGLPQNLSAALFVVWHTAPESPNLLPSILQRATPLPVASAEDGATIQAGRAYIARPDFHLAVSAASTPGAGIVRLTRGPKENRFRPAIDVLFRSAAVAFDSRVIGVVLTGALDDGASGLYAIKERGGVAVVQDPLDAECPNMPINAMRATDVDHVAPIAQMSELLVRLANEPLQEQSQEQEGGGTTVPENLKTEVRIALEDGGLENGAMELGNPSTFTCPECHGVLLQIKEGNLTRFRCHTGHAFTLDALLAELTKSSEETLWSALRSIQETELVLDHMAKHFDEAGEQAAAQVCLEKVQETKRRGDMVRQVILQNPF
jgi:two-component system chemotaxis response regulator CheB